MAYVDNGDDELDYEDEEFGERGAATGSGYPGGAIAALADEDVDDEDFDDLYNDVNVDFFPAPSGVARQSSGRFKGAENGAPAAAPSAVKVEFAEEDDEDRAGDGSYAEEQGYQERGQETGARAPALDSRRAQAGQERSGEGGYGQQGFGQAASRGPGSAPLLPASKPKEEAQEFAEEDATAARASSIPATQRPPLPKGTHEFGARAGTAGEGAGGAVKEEQYGEAESQEQGAAGLPKGKEEPEYSGSGQQGVYGKPGLDRGTKASAGAGGMNGTQSSEPLGGGRGIAKPAGSQPQVWVAPPGKVGGASQAGGGAGPPPIAAPPPVKDSAIAASDYMAKHGGGNQLDTGGTMLFVGELHWWTTDAELEAVLLEYGRVKNLKFFEEKASGKSKGYCQVEFFDAAAARLCKEKMDGRVFNGRSCVVAFASPQTIKQMGAAQVGKNQQSAQGQSQQGGQGQGKKLGDGGMGSRGGAGAGGVDGRGRMGMGRTQGPGMGGRTGQGPGRGRGGLGGRGGMGAVAPFGQGPPGPMGGPPGGMMPPQGMMGQGFDPGFGPPMGRGGYGMGPGGFVPRGPPGPFPGMGPPFPGMGPGLPGVGPHVNPAFFGRGQNGTGPGMGPAGMEGHPGAWGEGPMPGWGGEEMDRRMGVYGEDMGGADYGYGGEMVPDRMRVPNARDRERGTEGEWTASDRRRRVDERDGEWDRERHRERDREGYREALDRTREPRERPREREKDKEWEERERPSRGREKPRVGDDDERSRSRDDDYGKRRKVSQGERKIDR